VRIDPQTDDPPRRAPRLRPAAGTALYVHLPYCVEKCTYCDFFSVAADGEDLAGTLDALLCEADARAPAEPRTVFLGGGTPSLYETEELARLLDGLHERCGFRDSADEVTLECNPESLDRTKAAALRELGVDRLSIGVQSLRRETLELFGRVHDAEQALAAVGTALDVGPARVSFDVIYAAPGQRLEEWSADLERLLALPVTHVSAYHLAYEPGTLLTKWEHEGRVARHDEETELAFFRLTRARLAAAGLPGYELSNFAAPGAECRHNQHTWENGEYVGLGPSAVSYLDGTRFGNPRSITAWRRAVTAGGLAANWEETLSPRERLGETWWLGLRTARGVDPERARRAAGVPQAADPCLSLARQLEREGWLERTGPERTRWRIPEAHLPLADELSGRFLHAGEG